MLPPSECQRTRGSGGARKIISSFLLGALLTVVYAVPALASMEFAQLSVKKGLLLVASPSLEDPNFRQAVVLIVEYGPNGTLGLILNRSTKTLLSDVLPEVTALKGTTHRVFSGGPVAPSNLLVLFRLMEPYADARSVFDGVYVGGTPRLLDRMITQAKPTETFRAFAGSAGWAPRQLEAELLVGAWGVLPADSFSIFDQDPATLWQDCISRLQGPRVIGAAWLVPGAHGTEEGMEAVDLLCSRNARSKTSLVGRAQWEINHPPSLKENERAWRDHNISRSKCAVGD